jgi:hypothetical protein
MKISTMIAAAGMLAAAGAANAQLGGLTWTFDNYGGSGSFTDNGSVASVTGDDSGQGGYTDYYTTAPSAGTVMFDWFYTSNDSGQFDHGFYQVNFGPDNILAYNENAPVGGSVSFPVANGDIFGFGVFSADGIFGPGTLEVSNFKFVPIPGPASFALLGLGGLAMARRRR